MPKDKLIESMNEILGLFVLGDKGTLGNVTGRTFTLGQERPLSLVGESAQKFDPAVERLFPHLRDAKATLSKEKLVRELMPEILKKKTDNSHFTEAECDSFQQRILAFPIEKYRILRPIFGVSLPSSSAPVRVGSFTIYDSKRHLNEIAKGPPSSVAIRRDKKPPELLIECVVEARDGTRAEELADVLFRRFELVIRFFIGCRTSRFEVGVLNYVGPQLRHTFVIGGNETISGSAWKGALESIPISDPFFCSPSPPLARLLRLVVTQASPLERHMLRCTEWTAEAIGDSNAASAFVKAAIALEVLFSNNEKGVITPSIMAQIAEGCAFLLGDSPAGAAEIERSVKRLYGIRSAVVHSGDDSVGKDDLDALIRICRDAVMTLLSSRQFESVEAPEGLAKHFRAKKYASVKASPD